jgi:predicted acylesterase/phospholipase RssA
MVAWSLTRRFSGLGKAGLDWTRWLFRSIFGAPAAHYRAPWRRCRRVKRTSNIPVAPRAGTDSFKRIQQLRRAAADLLDKLPDDLRRSPEAALLRSVGDRKVYNIVHLIYRAKKYEGQSKDYDFSRASMEEHWRAGYRDAIRTLRHPEVLERPTNHEGIFTFDLSHDDCE